MFSFQLGSLKERHCQVPGELLPGSLPQHTHTQLERATVAPAVPWPGVGLACHRAAPTPGPVRIRSSPVYVGFLFSNKEPTPLLLVVMGTRNELLLAGLTPDPGELHSIGVRLVGNGVTPYPSRSPLSCVLSIPSLTCCWVGRPGSGSRRA